MSVENEGWNLDNVKTVLGSPEKGSKDFERSQKEREEKKLRRFLESTGIPGLLRGVVREGLVPDGKVVWGSIYSSERYVGIHLYFGKEGEGEGCKYKRVTMETCNGVEVHIRGDIHKGAQFNVDLKNRKGIEEALGLALAKPEEVRGRIVGQRD